MTGDRMRDAAAGRWEPTHCCAYGHTVSFVKPHSTELSSSVHTVHSVLNQTAKCCTKGRSAFLEAWGKRQIAQWAACFFFEVAQVSPLSQIPSSSGPDHERDGSQEGLGLPGPATNGVRGVPSLSQHR